LHVACPGAAEHERRAIGSNSGRISSGAGRGARGLARRSGPDAPVV